MTTSRIAGCGRSALALEPSSSCAIRMKAPNCVPPATPRSAPARPSGCSSPALKPPATPITEAMRYPASETPSSTPHNAPNPQGSTTTRTNCTAGALDERRDRVLGDADFGQPRREAELLHHPADMLGQRVADLFARAADLEAKDLVDLPVAVRDRLTARGVVLDHPRQVDRVGDTVRDVVVGAAGM